MADWGVRIPLYASEPEHVARAVADRLAAAAIAHELSPARHATPSVWGTPPGEWDVVVDHQDLAPAREALSDHDPAPVAGRPAEGGTVVLRTLEQQPGWTDLLGRGPAGVLRVVRSVPIRDRSQLNSWERRVRTELWQATANIQRSLDGWAERTTFTPRVVSCAPSETEPALELVLEPRPGPATRLPKVWARGPAPLYHALLAYRTLREAGRMASGRGLALRGLHPDGLLVHDDGRLQWGDAGLGRLLQLAGGAYPRTPPPWAVPSDEWDRDPVGAFRCEAVSLVRSLMCGGPEADLPQGLSSLDAFFGWARAERPEPEAQDEAWLQALRASGVCGRCGVALDACACRT